MLDMLEKLAVGTGDGLLGWALHLPTDFALLMLAMLSAVLMVLGRRLVTDGAALRLCRNDMKRLKQLRAEARKARDRDAKKRIGTSIGQIQMKQFGAEMKALAAAIIPIAILATWGWQRLGYLPPRDGETLEVRLRLPVSSVGRAVHLTPLDRAAAPDGWVVPADLDLADGKSALAVWKLRAPAADKPYDLRFVSGAAAYDMPLRVGQSTYAPPEMQFDPPREAPSARVVLRPYRPLGFLPGYEPLGIAPWMTGYLVAILPLTWLLKRATGTC